MVCAAILTVVVPGARANTYYVSTNGSDSAAGDSLHPWLTLQKAANTVAAGDLVDVRPGTYVGFYLSTSGTTNSPITFSAEPGAIINQRNATTADGINLESAAFVTIQGFTMNGNGIPPGNPDGTTNANGTRAAIRAVTGTNVIVQNNTCNNWGEWGIFTGFEYNMVIQNNVASNSVEQHGIYFSNSGDHPIIRGNITFGNAGCGIQINPDVSESGLGADGLTTGALVEKNIVYNNCNGKTYTINSTQYTWTGGGAGLNFQGLQYSTIQNNLVYNNTASGLTLFLGDAAEGSINNQISNNTIVMPHNGGRNAVLVAGDSGNNVFYNNILYTDKSGKAAINISSTDGSLFGFISDYNAVCNAFGFDDTTSTITLAAWRTATYQDTNSFVATPSQLFVNATNNDYRLKPGSPAIDAGTSTNAPSTDLLGNARPYGNGYDIGAYEFSAAKWQGAVNNVWDYATTNWNPSVTYIGGQPALFDDSGTNTSINLTTNVAPTSVTVYNSLLTYSFGGTGAITGAAALIKQGTGLLAVAGSNSYTGGTQVQAGTLQVNATSALGAGTNAVWLGNTAGSDSASLLLGAAMTIGRNIFVQSGSSGLATLGGSNTNGAAVYAGSLTLQKNLTLIAAANGTVTLQGALWNTNATGATLTKVGAGTLIINGPQTHAAGAAFYATAGVAHMNSDAGAGGANLSVYTTNPGTILHFGATQHLNLLNVGANTLASVDANGQNVIVTAGLTIAASNSNSPGGTLDLHNNALIITGATAATESAVAALIASGRNGGNWQGPGVTSSMVAAHTNSMTIACDFASNIHLSFTNGFATWFGQSISSTNAGTDLLVMPTLVGDANLDGYVNFVDVTQLIPNLGSTPGQTWGSGDFSGDGYVNFVDVTDLIPNLGQSVGSLSPAAAPGLIRAPGDDAGAP